MKNLSKGSTTTWVVVIVIIVIVIGGIWWWSSAQNSASTDQTQSTTQSSEKSITSFSFAGLSPEVSGAIDNTNYSVSLNVPAGTDVTSLTPTITVSDNATITPSSDTAKDFTNPVSYTITAQDGSTQNYTVTVTTATPAATGE